MDRRRERTFFLRHTDGPQAHEKIVSIANHQRNANQNHNKMKLEHIFTAYTKT